MAGSSRARRAGSVTGLLTAAVATFALVAADAQGFSTASSGLAASTSSTAGKHGGMGEHTTLSPGEFRLTMERLLGQHAVLAVWLMRAPADVAAGTEDAGFDAARAELQRDTREIAQAVAAMHGKKAGARFAALWRARASALEAYGTARAAGDEAGVAAAQQELAQTSDRYGSLVAALAGSGDASAGQAAAGLQSRTAPLLAATDAYAAGQYPDAFTRARAAYSALFRQGLAFVTEAAPSRARGSTAGFAGQATDLRSALGELFGEHAALAFDASRAVVSASPAAPATADALNVNTAAVVEAVRAALGPEAATAVSQVWAAHIDALMQFAVAVAGDDDAAQARARAALDQFPARLGAVLAGVAGGGLAARRLVASLRKHDQLLLQQVTAFAAEDYTSSAQLAYRGYDHMFSLARMLADALEGRATAAAPRRGAHTGAGGMSR
jgi:hypothetical protein